MGGSNHPISPVEAMRETLFRSGFTNILTPDKNMKEEIGRIIALPFNLPSDELNEREREILWQYRHSLIDNANAAVKFVSIVDWRQVDQAKSGGDLLSQWTDVGVDTAMKQLTKRWRNVPVVRKFAIEALERLPNDELELFMLQFVQALRHETLPQVSCRRRKRRRRRVEEFQLKQAAAGAAAGAAAEERRMLIPNVHSFNF